jgi:DNA-binding GntR family transcriptional regulator
LYEDLKELKKKHGIYSPIQKKVENALAKKLEERAVIRQLENGKRTIEEIASSSKELSRSLIRSALQRLEEKGKVTINRKRKPFVIHLKK